MGLQSEWKMRIEAWLEELPNWFYEPVGKVPARCFFTKEHFDYQEAEKRAVNEIAYGTPWGEKWEYGWFFAKLQIDVPEGKRVLLRPLTGGEMIVWVDGIIRGSVDLQHQDITLTRNALGNEIYFIGIESYAGHGPRPEGAGPCPEGRITVPEPPKHQCTFKGLEYGIFDDEAFALYMDAITLYKLMGKQPVKSLRYMKLLEGLSDFTKVVDFEGDKEKVRESFKAGREVLRPLLECTNGSTAPEFTIFGQSHLDLAWKWPWEETRRKCARTLSTQLALMEEYPDYKFMICEPPIMETVKNEYPELYTRVKQAVKEGRFIPDGGMYIESDTNLPNGEYLVRQCVIGKNYYKDELDTDSKMLWIPDCFGFTAQLPQIMKKSGLEYFATQKIARAREGSEIFPYNVFYWEALDGSRVLTHFFKKNNARVSPEMFIERWEKDRVQNYDMDTMMYPFGFGDGGGGATREMLETVDRIKDLEGMPRTKLQSPQKFFEGLEAKEADLCRRGRKPYDIFRGEIYLAWHRGTYTAQSRTKKWNRRAEAAFHNAEWLLTLLGGADVKNELDPVLKKLLFNHFHDIIPGSSIKRVHDEAVRDLKSVVDSSNELICKYLEDPDDFGEKVLFNTTPFDRVETVESYMGTSRVIVPAFGYTKVDAAVNEAAKANEGASGILADTYISLLEDTDDNGNKYYTFENALVRAVIDHKGQVISYVTRDNDTEWIDRPGNRFLMYKDVNVEYDAWEIASYFEEMPVELGYERGEYPEIEVMDELESPYVCAIRVSGKLNDSPYTQIISLEAGKRELSFDTEIEWNETHKLLKAAFSGNVRCDDAISEVAFGTVKRPVHRSRRNDADHYEVSNHRYSVLSEPSRTFAVVNDCKYGISFNENEIELTLLRAPKVPDMTADLGTQKMKYYLAAWDTDFERSGVVELAYEKNIPLVDVTLAISKCEEFEGTNGSFMKVSGDGILLDTVKPAEDGSGDIVLRLYETYGSHKTARLSLTDLFPFELSGIYETNMLEDTLDAIDISLDNSCRNAVMEFKPHEIKTVRLIVK